MYFGCGMASQSLRIFCPADDPFSLIHRTLWFPDLALSIGLLFPIFILLGEKLKRGKWFDVTTAASSLAVILFCRIGSITTGSLKANSLLLIFFANACPRSLRVTPLRGAMRDSENWLLQK